MSGTKAHAEALKEEIAGVLATMGLRLSPEKTLVTHIDEGLGFLGWRIQRHRKRGTGKYYVYVYPAKKALAAIKAKIKAWCRQNINLPLKVLLIHLNRMLRGWAAHFKYGCSNATFSYLRSYLWKQVIRWQERKHRRTPLENNYADATASGPAMVAWNCSTRPESAPGATTTGEQRSRHRGRAQHEGNARPSGACGAPGALRGARRVREATRGTHRWQHRQGAPGRPHRGEWACRGGLADAGDVATGLCSTCPRRDVRGRFLAGWVRQLTGKPRGRRPSHGGHRRGEGPEWAIIREPLLMPRYTDIPGWVAVPGWQGPAAGRRQAAATDHPMASGYRCPRGREGARPGPGLTRAERGNRAPRGAGAP